jgi:2',3'-cyclic-nucleotide 2'-phosphodiesterase (5'-nucleotidase family)
VHAAGSGSVTFIHLGDIHGHLVSRPNMREGDPDYGQQLGGLAYVYDQIAQVRKRHPDALLINTGDTIQGSAEALFTSGGAIVEILNRFRIDAFVPGNWDFLYGTERFRELFAGNKPLANWHALSANLYYSTLYDFPATRYVKQAGQRVLPPYLIKQVGKLKVGIIGLTADRGPQAVSTRVTEGFTMTPGEFELRAAVPLLKQKHQVDLIVLISERGLAANLELAEVVPGIDVVLSSDMHEETRQVVVGKRGTLLIESGQDGTMVGELSVTVRKGRMTGHRWKAHRISTKNNKPDADIAALIERIRKPFVAAGFVTHVNPINGAVLRTPIDKVIGHTKTALHRSNFAGPKGSNAVIEGSSHNFLADAFRSACDADLGVMRGFRYGTHIAPGPIRLEDIYHYIPIGPQIACGKMSGDEIRMQIERSADAALSSYVGWWGGGWLVTFAGVTYDFDPWNTFGLRVSNLRVHGEPVDMQKMHSVAGYWYVDNPDMINRHKALDIKVLKDQDGGIMDATEIVAFYLQSLPDHAVDVSTDWVRLLRPLPKPIGPNREIQPWRGVPRPDY